MASRTNNSRCVGGSYRYTPKFIKRFIFFFSMVLFYPICKDFL